MDDKGIKQAVQNMRDTVSLTFGQTASARASVVKDTFISYLASITSKVKGISNAWTESLEKSPAIHRDQTVDQSPLEIAMDIDSAWMVLKQAVPHPSTKAISNSTDCSKMAKRLLAIPEHLDC